MAGKSDYIQLIKMYETLRTKVEKRGQSRDRTTGTIFSDGKTGIPSHLKAFLDTVMLQDLADLSCATVNSLCCTNASG